MIQTTLWRPDTCDCEIEYTWDDTVAPEVRTHSAKTVKGCQHHSAGDHLAKYNTVLAENQGKNRALKEIADKAPENVKDPVIDESGNVTGYKLKKDPEWSFDENRKLKIKLGFSDPTLKGKLTSDVTLI